MSRVKLLNILLLGLLLNACTMLDPFVDRRREAGARDMAHLYVGESKPDAPAICYNTWTTDMETLQKMADAECQKHKTGNRAVVTKETLLTCRFFLPNHLYFKCVK